MTDPQLVFAAVFGVLVGLLIASGLLHFHLARLEAQMAKDTEQFAAAMQAHAMSHPYAYYRPLNETPSSAMGATAPAPEAPQHPLEGVRLPDAASANDAYAGMGDPPGIIKRRPSGPVGASSGRSRPRGGCRFCQSLRSFFLRP